MKIWTSYGTEHSMNLVMIGHFKTVQDAEKAEKLIDAFKAVIENHQDENIEFGGKTKRYPTGIMDFIRQNELLYEINPSELDQLLYDVSIKRKGNLINVFTDEFEVSLLMKIFIMHEARVEVYSSSHHGDGTDQNLEGN